jgi:hypothetical protein
MALRRPRLCARGSSCSLRAGMRCTIEYRYGKRHLSLKKLTLIMIQSLLRESNSATLEQVKSFVGEAKVEM